ncbi:MAG: RNA 2',3'-cyclic phosphodiesterase [Candidatus Aminicenantes bacterium]|nr:RNA 2',3'-cyclic phosphodiesterase [Candidatus Aminicenantes bacterium]
MRTFVALELNPEIRSHLSELIALLSCSQSNIKWVREEGMHLTLKFLGEIPDKRISEIKTAIQEACDGHPSFSLSFKGTSTFPHASVYPRVFWVGIEECKALAALHKDLEIKLAKLHFPREKRKFSPHLTLGRVKSKENLEPVLDELEKHRTADFGNLCVQNVIFFKSTLKPSGAEYTRIAEFRLK